MLRAPHSAKNLPLIMSLLLVPHTSWAEVDTPSVAKILGVEELSEIHIPGKPDERCKTDAEFDELTEKYFGVTK